MKKNKTDFATRSFFSISKGLLEQILKYLAEDPGIREEIRILISRTARKFWI